MNTSSSFASFTGVNYFFISDILTSKIQFEGDVLSYKQVFAELMTISHDRL